VVGPEVTFVLVHGGGMSGAYWDLLRPHLERPSLAPDLPGRRDKPADPMTLTVDECVRSVADDVRAAGAGDVVLVAHSSGGLLAPGIAAELADRVRHVVLDVAQVPPDGGTGLDAMKESHRTRIIEGMDWARSNGRVLTTPGPEAPDKVREAYGGDPLTDEQIAFMTDPVRCVEDSMSFYFQPVSWSAAPAVPVTYLEHTRDRPTPPALQDDNIARLAAAGRVPAVEVLDCGHIPAGTNAEELAVILNRIAKECEAA
jgi:pimeloyl-ACP methyl ester carboxylesterase